MSITLQDAIKIQEKRVYLNSLIAGHGILPEIIEADKLLLEAIKENAERENPKPLTLEELKQMDGDPVWVRVSNNWRESSVSEGWCLVRFHTSDDRVRVYIWDTRHGARFFAQQDLGISWWAYRYIPKSSENAVWSEECQLCHGKGYEEVPFTRADHIRSQNDEELSKEFYTAIDAAFSAIGDLLGLKISFSDFVYEDEWKNKFTEWLKQPADMPEKEEEL